MDSSTKERIRKAFDAKRKYFDESAFRSLKERLHDLKILKSTIQKYEVEILEALKKDFNKPFFESYATEIGLVYKEIDFLRNNLKNWMRPHKVFTSIVHFPSSSRTQYSPLGVILVISPWNYPFMLSMIPLIDAIAAGNCVILKPAHETQNCSAVMEKIIIEALPQEKASLLLIDNEFVIPTLIGENRFDQIFFTGSQRVGRLIYEAAVKDLTPVTLELGGKSPCVIDHQVNLEVAAKRIAWGKFVNAGQTCVAPDYILIPEQHKDKFIEKCAAHFEKMLTDEPAENYAQIIDKKHFNRLQNLIDNSMVHYGRKSDPINNTIYPTIVNVDDIDDHIMKEEIFGPILPIITYKDKEEVQKIISKNPNPLAFYIYSKNQRNIKWYLREIQFGGSSINNCLVHLGSNHIPFGGVGSSGFGRYHGKYGFETFSHLKGIIKTGTWYDLPIKYAPYIKGKLNFLKKIMK